MSLPLVNLHLLTIKVVTKIGVMTNADRYKNWFSSMTGQRITAQDIADQLDISRNATNSRMAKGLTADDIITIARGFDINPVTALQELGHVGVDEIFDHLDDDGKRLVTAAPDELVFHLAQDMLSVDQKLALVRDVMSRAEQSTEGVGATVFEFPNRQSASSDIPQDAVADDSDYHEEENTEFDD